MFPSFLFASLSSKVPNTTRKFHIRQLFDVLQLSLHRGDIPRATRAWTILARCKEMNWMTLWSTALHILGTDEGPNSRTVSFLRDMMLQYPVEVRVRSASQLRTPITS